MEFTTLGLMEVDETDAVSTARMKEIEDGGEKLGISMSLMMENAGSAIADFIFQNRTQINRADDKIKVLLVAGVGNNGGDVFVAARHLAYWNRFFAISVALLGSESNLKSELTRTNFNILRSISSEELIQIDNEMKLVDFQRLLSKAEVVVIGIFGTGFRGEVHGIPLKIIDLINESQEKIKISVDIPSGLEADSGLGGAVVASNYTITMHAPKKGMYATASAKRAAVILAANIGVPK